jgi:hypothetical protein
VPIRARFSEKVKVIPPSGHIARDSKKGLFCLSVAYGLVPERFEIVSLKEGLISGKIFPVKNSFKIPPSLATTGTRYLKNAGIFFWFHRWRIFPPVDGISSHPDGAKL